MTYQLLHNLELLKLDLSSLTFVAAGAAYLPPELRVAFERRAKNLPFFFEGSDRSCHRCTRLVLLDWQDMVFPKAYVSQAVCRSPALSRFTLDRYSHGASLSGHAWGSR